MNLFVKNIIEDFELLYPLDIHKFCEKLNIKIYHKDLSSDGCLVCKNGKTALIVNQNKPQREKFTIAHELGHFFIPNHTKLVFSCSNIGDANSSKGIEREADDFASELLLPQHLLSQVINKEFTIELICTTAKLFETSLLSTAIKLTKLTYENAILVFLRDGKYYWHVWSDNSFMRLNTKADFSSLQDCANIYSDFVITNSDDIKRISIERSKINKSDEIIIIKEVC